MDLGRNLARNILARSHKMVYGTEFAVGKVKQGRRKSPNMVHCDESVSVSKDCLRELQHIRNYILLYYCEVVTADCGGALGSPVATTK